MHPRSRPNHPRSPSRERGHRTRWAPGTRQRRRRRSGYVVGGAAIESGDVIVGDKNGVAVVPRARVAEVVAALAEVAQKEAQMDEASLLLKEFH